MAPILTLTSDLWSTWGYRRIRRPDQGGKRQFTLRILSDMQVNGWKQSLPASLTKNESRYRRSDGQYRWHLDRGVPLRDEDGNIVKWYGVATDIEDRKHAEQKLCESEAYLAEAQRLS